MFLNTDKYIQKPHKTLLTRVGAYLSASDLFRNAPQHRRPTANPLDLNNGAVEGHSGDIRID